MGCAASEEEKQDPVVEEQPKQKGLGLEQRKRSPTPDKEIADSGTLFGLLPTDANDLDDPK
jgi:hypothetical protein